MQHFNRKELDQLGRFYRSNIINSLSGFKSLNLIGTKSVTGQTNLAIFNSCIHIGANPPLQGFIHRPISIEKHTYTNIEATGYYTINHVPESHYQAAHRTSGKFTVDQSEFAENGFTEQYLDDFPAPYVGESPIKYGLEIRQIIPIELNNTFFFIGEIQHIYIEEPFLLEDGNLDLVGAGVVAGMGLDGYTRPQLLERLPYVGSEVRKK